jgi:hypothetical protein
MPILKNKHFYFPAITSTLMSILVSGCSFSTSSVDNESKNVVKNNNEPAQQTIINANPRDLIRQFENEIAQELILNTEEISATAIFSKKDLLEKQQAIDHNLQQLLKLDAALLSPKLKPSLHRFKMLSISLHQQKEKWEKRNNFQEILKLIPAISFEKLTAEEIQKIKNRTLKIPEALEKLKQDIRESASYREEFSASDAYICTALGNPDNNLIFSRYQQILAYSNFSTEEQKDDYQSFRTSVGNDVIPTLNSFCNFLHNAPEKTDYEQPKAFSKKTGNNSNALKHELENRIEEIDLKIMGLTSQQSLRVLYGKNLKIATNQGQISLDQMTQIVADLHYGLDRWFTDPMNQEVLIAASDQLEISPFYYQFNTAFFDLDLISSLPVFELETLAYQYTIPGIHMLPYSSAEQDDPLWRAYAYAWSIYALTLPQQPDYYTHSLSRIAALSRRKLAMLKALTDINLREKNWNADQAENYLYENTPYEIQLIKREVLHLISSPNEAANAWLISQALEKLWQLDHGLTRAKFNDRLLSYVPANLDFLTNEMPEIILSK